VNLRSRSRVSRSATDRPKRCKRTPVPRRLRGGALPPATSPAVAVRMRRCRRPSPAGQSSSSAGTAHSRRARVCNGNRLWTFGQHAAVRLAPIIFRWFPCLAKKTYAILPSQMACLAAISACRSRMAEFYPFRPGQDSSYYAAAGRGASKTHDAVAVFSRFRALGILGSPPPTREYNFSLPSIPSLFSQLPDTPSRAHDPSS